MAFFDWTENLSVGVNLIDDDHRVLIDLINQLHDSLNGDYEREIVASVLNTLVDYTVFHFKREEAVMAACGYPDREAHKVQHASMVRGVLKMDRRHRDDINAKIGPEVLTFLNSWLTEHIQTRDKELQPFIDGKPEAVNAAESVPRIQATGHGFAEGPVALDPEAVQDLAILVVHPSDEFRRLLATILFSAGVEEIVEAKTAAEALDCLDAERPDIVYYDWRLPDMDIVEFTKELRAGVKAKTPLVMFFGTKDDRLRESLRDEGANVFLSQPLTARSVLLALESGS